MNIEIRPEKTLVLTNVLARRIPNKEFLHPQKQIELMNNWIKSKEYSSLGPLVIHSKGIKGFDATQNPISDSYVLLQLRNTNVNIEVPYIFEQSVRIENCIFARFEGNAEFVRFASMKLEVYAFENEIELSGESYTVFVKEENGIAIIDIFMLRKENT